MKISNSPPPNIEEMKRAFPLCEEKQAVFCYGNIIYNPYRVNLTPDILEHEAVHYEQQQREPSIELWYVKYINDEAFRLAQEVEAYQRQYAYVSKRVKDREIVSWFLGKLAESLSSPLYGALCTASDARQMIKKS